MIALVAGAGEFPAFTAVQSWALIICAGAVVLVLIAEFAANGADVLDDIRVERDYDDRIKAPYPPRPAAATPPPKPAPHTTPSGRR